MAKTTKSVSKQAAAAGPVRDAKPSKVSKKPAAPAKETVVKPAPIEPALRGKRNAGLTAAEARHFKDLLLAKRGALVGDVTSMANEALGKNRQDASGDLSNMPIHMADIGSDNYEQEFTLGLMESEQVLLLEINAALARMDKGVFGICLGTGRAIGKARLEAKPWARYSIDYARLVEKGLAPEVEIEDPNAPAE